ncbi:MAG: SDR family oxidoreductase [Pseudomonadota bacterium]
MGDRVAGKVIIVTGAASGLGKADAIRLAEEGATVVLTDINEDAGTAVAAECGGEFVRQDVADESGWQALIDGVVDRHGRLDGLVNNAGTAPISTIETITTEEWRRHLGIHLDGTFFGCRYALPALKAAGGGSIVNMSSVAALSGLPGYLVYSTAKGGIAALTRSVARHCVEQAYGIRCNSVHPGSISTPMVHNAIKSLQGIDIEAAEDPEAMRKEMGFGAPEDVANMILFLMSDESRHVNGAQLVIDNTATLGLMGK